MALSKPETEEDPIIDPEQEYYDMLRYDHALDAEESRKYVYDPDYQEDNDSGCLNRNY